VKLKKNKNRLIENRNLRLLYKKFYFLALIVSLLFLTGCINVKKRKSIFSSEVDDSKIKNIVMKSISLAAAISNGGFIVPPFAKNIKCLGEDDFIVCDFIFNEDNKSANNVIDLLVSLYIKQGWSFTEKIEANNYITISGSIPNKILSITVFKKTKKNVNMSVHQSVSLI